MAKPQETGFSDQFREMFVESLANELKRLGMAEASWRHLNFSFGDTTGQGVSVALAREAPEADRAVFGRLGEVLRGGNGGFRTFRASVGEQGAIQLKANAPEDMALALFRLLADPAQQPVRTR